MSGKLSSQVRQACTPTACVVDHLNQLDMQMQEYLNELSRIMFKKKNLRGMVAPNFLQSLHPEPCQEGPHLSLWNLTHRSI